MNGHEFHSTSGDAGDAREFRRFALRSARGYTGPQSIDGLLSHNEFVDVSVELFVRHRAEPWVRLGAFDIDRRLPASAPAG